jgi:hypothetical protein
MEATVEIEAGAPQLRRESRRSATPPSIFICAPRWKVAERAYAIWQASGCPRGCDLEHWFQAERELTTSPFALRTPPR